MGPYSYTLNVFAAMYLVGYIMCVVGMIPFYFWGNTFMYVFICCCKDSDEE